MTNLTYRDSLILCFLALSLPGCSSEPAGLFFFDTIEPNDQLFQQDFSQARALLDQHGQVSCILNTTKPQANTNSVNQTLILRTFWLPNHSKTPLSPSSTNVNIEYLIESSGSFALYRGAGFAQVKNVDSLSDMELNLRSSQIRLYRQTPGFKPTFITTNLTGRIMLDYAPDQAQNLIEIFNNKIRDLTK